jgi:hypothetical protein
MDVMLILPAVLAAVLAVAPGCAVSDASLSWGFKESFRAYIDGDIANGEWTTADGATYDTPAFGWSGGTGRYDPATGQGYISFTGSVHFTGHDGLLDTTIADPFIRLDTGGSGVLLLDVSGPTMDGTQIDQQDVEFAAIPSLQVVGGDAVRTIDAGTALTPDGAVAFPNYEAGTAFDPVAISMTVGKVCAVAADAENDIGTEDDGGALGVLLLIVVMALGIPAAIGVFMATRLRRG